MTTVPTSHAHHNIDHAHQFDDAEQHHYAVNLGMWAFLLTEVMFFGGAFCAFFIYRYQFGETFYTPGYALDWVVGSINTGVLLCSSLTMAMAVHSAQLRHRKLVVLFLVLTMLLGLSFLGVKVYEYGQKFEHHDVPTPAFNFGKNHYGGFDYHPAEPVLRELREAAKHDPRVWDNVQPKARMFFSFYFVMTGIHALHMIAGIGVMAFMLRPAWRGKYTTGANGPNQVEMTGLYWHFVDIVWIFLFPIMYLSHWVI
jgi:cytochrome c oxidase subunit III